MTDRRNEAEKHKQWICLFHLSSPVSDFTFKILSHLQTDYFLAILKQQYVWIAFKNNNFDL